jgi:hypothetical protein
MYNDLQSGRYQSNEGCGSLLLHIFSILLAVKHRTAESQIGVFAKFVQSMNPLLALDNWGAI